MLHISYLYRIHAATFLPFRAYSIDNQLIIDTRGELLEKMPHHYIMVCLYLDFYLLHLQLVLKLGTKVLKHTIVVFTT